MRVLSEQNLIARSGNSLRILDPERLARLADYNDRHEVVDRSWLPPARS
jgi:hypothetical protein